MEGIDYNFMALAACVLNINLTRTRALEIMGITEQIITKKMLTDNFTIKKCEKENIERLYNDGATMKDLGVIYNTTAATVSRFMIKNAIQRRTRGTRKEGAKICQSC